MERIVGPEEEMTILYANSALLEAKKSPCFRSKCGSIIKKLAEVIGKGHNGPAEGRTLEACFKDTLPSNFKSDRTCCRHAEQRAIADAREHKPEKLPGSTLYFIRLDENENMARSGEPYCTICSKEILDARIGEVVLLHKTGFYKYTAIEFDDYSFGLKPWKPAIKAAYRKNPQPVKIC